MIDEEYGCCEVPGKESSKKEESAMIPYLWPTNIVEEGPEKRTKGRIHKNREKKSKYTGIPKTHLDIQSAFYIRDIEGKELGRR